MVLLKDLMNRLGCGNLQVGGICGFWAGMWGILGWQFLKGLMNQLGCSNLQLCGTGAEGVGL